MTGTLHFPGDVGGDLDRLLTLIETAHEHGDEAAIVEQAAKVRAALTPSALPATQEDAERSGVGVGTLADIVVKLSAIRTVIREAHFALDDSEDQSHLDPPVHAVPFDNVMRLHRALKACERFAPKDEGWDGPGPLVTQIIDQLGHCLKQKAYLPERIGRLTLGEKLSSDHYCGGSHEMPDGHPVYWQERAGEYPDDIEGFCLACAIVNAESEAGWCECSVKEALSTPAMSTPQRQEYDGEAVREAARAVLADADRPGSRMLLGDDETPDSWIEYREVGQVELDALAAALAHPAQATPSDLRHLCCLAPAFGPHYSHCKHATITPSALSGDAGEIERLRAALSDLLARDVRNTCQHENTHRGGAIWEICDGCGAKWADDEGGKPAWSDPIEWIEARAALSDRPQAEGEVK